jgi:hypothetical protein
MTLLRAAILAGTLVALPAVPFSSAHASSRTAIGTFHDELLPFGRWVDCRYGRCWIPADVGADWQPYSNGQWLFTEFGWTWSSAEPFGGTPFHYGAWSPIDGHRWAWVPGTVWAPAWVTWSYSSEEIGWAPVPPSAVFDESGRVRTPDRIREAHFVFVPAKRFVGRSVAVERRPAGRNAKALGRTRRASGLSISAGILRDSSLPIELLENIVGGPVPIHAIELTGTLPRAPSDREGRHSVVGTASEMDAARGSGTPASSGRNGDSDHERPPRE